MTRSDPGKTTESLPTKNDFNPWGPGALDAECAWGNFGGLTLTEAHAKFRERPDIYQEDFMFMGGRAFAFYFPVIETYLREVPEETDEGDDHEAWILAKCIRNQFHAGGVQHVLHLTDPVITLSHFVRENIRRFGYDEAEHRKVADAWRELEEHVQSLKETGLGK